MSTRRETKEPVAKAPKTRRPLARAEAAPTTIYHVGAAIPPAAHRRLDAHGFADVGAHIGDVARGTARAVDANASTVGRDIFFAAGKYAEEPR